MSCYVNNRPCSCTIDQMSEGECPRDVSVDIHDPFRGARDCEERDHLLYLNGETRAESRILG
jgi:hypothetical protein